MKTLIAVVSLATLIVGTWFLYTQWDQSHTSSPYSKSGDTNALLQAAFASAKTTQKPLFVIFGADWCPDCRALDQAMKEEPNLELVSQSFTVVKVDVGRFDKNMDISKTYGDITKKGIPAAVLLSPVGEVIYATNAGELSSAKRMGSNGIYDFLSDLAKRGRIK